MTEFIEAAHYDRINLVDWPGGRFFSPQELACRGTGKLKINHMALAKLVRLRRMANAPMIINSAYRSPEHNARVGGAKNSRHLQGDAFDVSMANHDPEKFVAAAKAAGFTGIGWYPPKKGNFIHIDTGPARTWGQPWKAPRFDAEPPAPVVSKPQAAVGAIAVASAGVAEVIQPATLMAVQETVQPMIAYSDVFRTIFMLAGVGLVAWLLWSKFTRKAP